MILGTSSVGKSYLAQQALVNAACRRDYTARYYRLDDLANRLAVLGHADAQRLRYIFEKGPWSVVAVETHHTGITHIEHRPQPNRPDWWLHYHNLTHHLTDEMRT